MTSGTSINLFLAQVNLPLNLKILPFFLAEMSKSHWKFVLLDAILHAFLPNSVETSFLSQSYIYLEVQLTEFFCNLSVQSL